MFRGFPNLLTRVVDLNVGIDPLNPFSDLLTRVVDLNLGIDPPESAPTFLLALRKPSLYIATRVLTI